MRISKMLLICICCLIAAPAVWGQAANSQVKPGILGYLDPHTGAFRPIAPAAEDAGDLLPTTAVFTGTINLTINVTIKSATLLTTTPATTVACSMEVFLEDNISSGSPRLISESNTVLATGSGSTWKCTLSIPYSWALATASTDSFTASYFVTGNKATITGVPNRTSTLSPYATTKVPSTGTTTTLVAAAVTI